MWFQVSSPCLFFISTMLTLYSLLWTANLTNIEPMTIQLSPHLQTVAVGARNCPDNSKSTLYNYDISTGNIKDTIPAISQFSLARGGSTFKSSIAGMGWNKALSTLDIYGPSSYTSSIDGGEPAMQLPTSISSDGTLSAFLYEPKPTAGHLNNRSAVLNLVNQHGDVVYTLKETGQAEYDPQSISMSSYSNNNRFTVGAVLGSINKIIDYNTETKQGNTVWSSQGLEIDIAVNGFGNYFAVTSGGGFTVDVWARTERSSSSSSSSSSAAFTLLSTIKPPSNLVQPMTLMFDRVHSTSSFLTVAWGDQNGVTLIITTHVIDHSNNTIQSEWNKTITCEGNGNFDYVMQTGLAVSGGGEVVAMGDWGCQTTAGQDGQVLVFQGRQGDGTTVLMNATMNGEIWAIDVDMDMKTKTMYVSAGSWSNRETKNEAEVKTWSGKWKGSLNK